MMAPAYPYGAPDPDRIDDDFEIVRLGEAHRTLLANMPKGLRGVEADYWFKDHKGQDRTIARAGYPRVTQADVDKGFRDLEAREQQQLTARRAVWELGRIWLSNLILKRQAEQRLTVFTFFSRMQLRLEQASEQETWWLGWSVAFALACGVVFASAAALATLS